MWGFMWELCQHWCWGPVGWQGDTPFPSMCWDADSRNNKKKNFAKSWCCNTEQQEKLVSQAKLAEPKSLGLLPFFKLWSQWGRTVYRLHMGCSLLHWSPGGSLPKAQMKVWYPAPGGFQWDAALSFPLNPFKCLLSAASLRIAWGVGK